MGAIYGLLRLDGGPVAEYRPAAMRLALGGPGGTPGTEWASQDAFLGQLDRLGPARAVGASPLAPDPAGQVLVASARLDYRDDLRRELGLPPAGGPVLSDTALVRMAHARWGEESVHHLYGDWSFAAWDPRNRRLLLARDGLGNTGLFLLHRPPLVAFASTLPALRALAGVRFDLDEWALARYLVVFPWPAPERDRTIFEGVRQLLPAEVCNVSERGVTKRTYWDLAAGHPAQAASGEEWVGRFLDLYRAAVRTRLEPGCRPSSTLSSGLDSGSVTALAAEALLERGEELPAFTSVPLHPAESLFPRARVDEWPLAATVAGRWPNVRHVGVKAERVSPVVSVREAATVAGMPLHAAANQFWMAAIYDECRQRGLDVLLTGQLGNGGVSWAGGGRPVFDLLRGGHLIPGLRALGQWKRHRQLSWARAVRSAILAPWLGPLWRRRGQLLHPRATPWAGYAAVAPAFARRMKLEEAMREQGHDPSFSRRLEPAEARWQTVFMNGAMAGPIYHASNLHHGLSVLDPTADVRLLEFCFRVPPEEDVHDGGDRMLIRRAMEGLLPPAVQWNTLRGSQAADIGFRLLDHPADMEDALGRLASSHTVREYLDVEGMRRAWEELQRAVTPSTSGKAAIFLLRGIMAGEFLLQAGGDSGPGG